MSSVAVSVSMSSRPLEAPTAVEINAWVDRAVASTPIYDLHTHIYPPTFGPLMLWGIDELINYHYLVAETLRADPSLTYARFWSLSPAAQAEAIWRVLFVERAPLSEACRGVLTVLKQLGGNPGSKSLEEHRAFFRGRRPQAHLDQVLARAKVHTVVMTNNIFDPEERDLWLRGVEVDPRFKAVVRLDPLLREWPKVADTLVAAGYHVRLPLDAAALGEIRRFLIDWIRRTGAIYLAASLTPDWRYPDDSPGTRVINEAILPVCREHNLPMALMIGVRPQVNPQLRVAGDAMGPADIASLDRLCAGNPGNKFMATVLSRESQHGLAVAARKHPNLFLFGCWWFMNNPVLIDETTRFRIEMLGTSFAPQHSDARVLEQLLYKWDHTREIIARILKEKFHDLARTGWLVSEAEVRQTVDAYFSRNFADFIAR